MNRRNDFIKRWKVMTWRWVWHIKNKIKLKLNKKKKKKKEKKVDAKEFSVNLLVVYSISPRTIFSVEFSSFLRSSQFTMHTLFISCDYFTFCLLNVFFSSISCSFFFVMVQIEFCPQTLHMWRDFVQRTLCHRSCRCKVTILSYRFTTIAKFLNHEDMFHGFLLCKQWIEITALFNSIVFARSFCQTSAFGSNYSYYENR